MFVKKGLTELPLSLVEQAREAAQPLRRSAAGQIEYWATLGRVVEHSGLTVEEAQAAIEAYEAAARKAQQTRAVADLTSRLLAAEVSGSLAQRVREVVEENANSPASCMPVFHLLPCPNGAGRSTLYRAFVPDGVLSAEPAFINADLFERE
ncbi:hypothetical protein GCM10011496_08380 [Polaromonas eurypsychrophila]|uniref:ParD-like antitoxin of type II toxin-antitoxin system n=1 Tax=Polaromonas eurypsychrophila TaxID=1614635 RepID=A0A916SBM3_9BURK|nr:ParD-like family protein [Polaromonas eurypsychrophila]GGA89885.1 hypothetical protein GCM10011496_08380 [Polaromonas eurypsychrophila]